MLKTKSSLDKLILGILLAASVLTHFIFFGFPRQVVFDEVYFGKFVSAYRTGEYYFDIHPPLGKLIEHGADLFNHRDTSFNFGKIGDEFPSSDIIFLRVLPAIAGMLLPLVLYYLCRKLGFSPLAAFFVGATVILENSLLVQSRFILLDSFLLLFGFGGLALVVAFFQDAKAWKWYAALILLAASFSVKWTGFAFWALAGIYALYQVRKQHFEFKNIARRVAEFVIIPFLFYMAVFAVHFALLPKTGQGDAFMSPEFQKTLIGSRYQDDTTVKPIGFFAKFVELNEEMYRANATLTATHAYASKWWSWPLMLRGIYYWVGPAQGDSTTQIYLLGNPFIYWFGSLAVILGLFSLVFSKNRKHLLAPVLIFLLFSYVANLAPFIPITRVMFLYHYFAALIFSILILGFLIDTKLTGKWKLYTVIVLLVIFLAAFIFMAPLSYGLQLTSAQLQQHFILSSWR